MQYLQPCPEPQTLGRTNGALAEYTIGLRAALALCNADKAALRDWASSIK